MPEPLQLTIDGRQVPATGAPAPVSAPAPRAPAPARLFDAPQTIRGQIALPTDAAAGAPALERAEDLAATAELGR